VAAGSLSATSTDGVNGSQLFATNQALTTLNNSGVKYDTNPDGSVNYGSVTLGGPVSTDGGVTGGTTITNVHQGRLSSTSTDAVNGSQLYTTNQNVSNIQNILNTSILPVTKYVSIHSTGVAASATGMDAVAVGQGTVASGDNSVATGNGAVSSGNGAIATGHGSTASGDESVALGENASATGANSVALGAGSIADRDNSVSVGSAGHERQITNVAAGTSATDAVNLGQLQQATGDIVSTVNTTVNNIEQGKVGMFQVNNTSNLPTPSVSGSDSLSGGAGSSASGDNSMAVGTRAVSTGANSVALGNGAGARAANSVALGSNSIADRANTLSVGSVGSERQIANVAAGTQGTDAVNVNQLNQGVAGANQYTNQRFGDLKNQLDHQDNKLSAGVAGAMAMAGMPQPYSPGASMFGLAGGTYQGQSAIALGVSTISDNGKWVTKLTGTTNSQGDLGASVGVGYQW
jgi:autotransporter adhesin